MSSTTIWPEFPRFEATEAAGCQGRMRKKSMKRQRTSGEIRICISMTTKCTRVCRQRAPPPVGVTRFSQNKTNLLRNNNHRGDHTSNFRPLTILHTDFQILSKFFSRTYWLKDLFFLENDMPAQHRLV